MRCWERNGCAVHTELPFRFSVIYRGYRSNIKFAVQHIKKLYPLHITTMIIALVLNILVIAGDASVFDGLKLGFKVILNILLLQSWIPNVSINVSLNGVAWFLSSLFFCYYCFPILIKIFRRKKARFLVVMAIGILLSQLLITFVLVYLNLPDSIYRYAVYDAPFFRLGDFAIGVISGIISKTVFEKSFIKRHSRLFVIVTTVIGIAVNYWDYNLEHTSIVARILANWTTMYIPIAAILVLCLSYNRDMISNNQFIIYIGENSNYYFLIHYVVIMYVKRILKIFAITGSQVIIIKVISAGILTVILTEIYKIAEGKIVGVVNMK